MERKHRNRNALVTISTIIFLCIAHVSVALGQPAFPDEQTVRSLAYIWYQTTYTSDPDKYSRLAEYYHFTDVRDRQRFIDGRPEPNPTETGFAPVSSASDIVIAPRPDGLSDHAIPKSWIYVPRVDRGRRDSLLNWISLTFVHKNGSWKILFDPFSPTPREARDPRRPFIEAEFQINRLEEELRRWKAADADELAVLATQKIYDTLYTLSVLRHGPAGGADLLRYYTKRMEEYERRILRQQYDEIRAQVVDELESAVKIMRNSLDVRKRHAHSDLMNQWLDLNPAVSRNMVLRDKAVESMRNWLKEHDTLDGFVFRPDR